MEERLKVMENRWLNYSQYDRWKKKTKNTEGYIKELKECC